MLLYFSTFFSTGNLGFILSFVSLVLCDSSYHQHNVHLPIKEYVISPKSVGNYTRYKWIKVIGPNETAMNGVKSRNLVLEHIKPGFYGYRVLMTGKFVKPKTEIHELHVYRAINQRPVANAGQDLVVHLPKKSIVLSGNRSFDDNHVIKYFWSPAPDNPAGIQMLEQPVATDSRLLLTNLLPGDFTFTLTVEDSHGLRDHDDVRVRIVRDKTLDNAIEIRFLTDLRNFTKQDLKHFRRQVYLIIEKSIPKMRFHLETLKLLQDQIKGHAILIFFIKYGGLFLNNDKYTQRYKRRQFRKFKIFPASKLMKILRPVILENMAIFPYKIVQISTLGCTKPCFRHGYCDSITQKCICDIFWINNLWKTWTEGSMEQDCEWNLFVIGATGILFICILVVIFRYLYLLLSFLSARYCPYEDGIDEESVCDTTSQFR